MRRIFSLFFVGILVSISLVFSAQAECVSNNYFPSVEQTRYQFANGDYIVVTLEQSTSVSRATTVQKAGSKTFSYYGKNNALQWTFSLHAEFQVTTGISATCVSTRYSHIIYENGWHLSSASTHYQANKAYGNAEFYYSTTGLVRSCSVTLTCDTLGRLS